MPFNQAAWTEWRRAPLLPLAAGLGYATSVIHVYGLGPYIEPISREFGWSRGTTVEGLTLSMLLSAAGGIPIGLLVDRLGPRSLGVAGVLLVPAAFALLATATGGQADWYALWTLLALATLCAQSTIWTSAIATHFFSSRGLALAVGLCGSPLAVALFPWLGTKLIEAYGWRRALVYQACIWCAVTFPLVVCFFRDDEAARTKPVRLRSGIGAHDVQIGLLQGLHSSVYLRLLLASLLFTLGVTAIVVHFIPILTDGGVSKLDAAKTTALVGAFSVIGRLATGLLLDRFRASLIGAVAFALPALGCVLMVVTALSAAGRVAAAILIGLTIGAEIDVIVYLTARHFGLKHFGAVYGGLIVALAVGSALGPLAAARIFDIYRTYTPFLWFAVACMIVSSAALGSLPKYPDEDDLS
jgi:MFS family permease